MTETTGRFRPEAPEMAVQSQIRCLSHSRRHARARTPRTANSDRLSVLVARVTLTLTLTRNECDSRTVECRVDKRTTPHKAQRASTPHSSQTHKHKRRVLHSRTQKKHHGTQKQIRPPTTTQSPQVSICPLLCRRRRAATEWTAADGGPPRSLRRGRGESR